jgi:acetyltransferase
MDKLIRYCRERGIGELTGEVLKGNRRMLALANDLGFESHSSGDPSTVQVRLVMNRGAVSGQPL